MRWISDGVIVRRPDSRMALNRRLWLTLLRLARSASPTRSARGSTKVAGKRSAARSLRRYRDCRTALDATILDCNVAAYEYRRPVRTLDFVEQVSSTLSEYSPRQGASRRLNGPYRRMIAVVAFRLVMVLIVTSAPLSIQRSRVQVPSSPPFFEHFGDGPRWLSPEMRPTRRCVKPPIGGDHPA